MSTLARVRALEIVRGSSSRALPGNRFELTGGPLVLGRKLSGASGIELVEPEGRHTRRLAPHHALLERNGDGWIVRDLESDAGTLVNRQRLLPGQARPLAPGDLLDIGPVQLRVVDSAPRAGSPPPAASPRPPAAGPAPVSQQYSPPVTSPVASSPSALRPSTAAPGLFARPLELASGIRCRNWDEVLAVATQRWSVLRDALVSGELERRLASAGQSAWAPDPRQTGSADEKLDAWLARLPASRPAVAEWEVHPARIAVRATGAGGATRRSVTVQNVGHRLLSWQARLDPPAPWLAILAPSGRTQTVESDKIELEFRIPEGFTRRESTALVIESNAGVQRVELILEPAGPTTSTEIAQEPPTAQVLARPAWAEWSLMRRVGLGALTFAVLRTALAASSWFSAPSPGTSFPSLASALFTLSALGALMAGLLALRRKAMSDVGWSAAAGALAGVALAALTVALARTLEPLLGPVASHPLAAIVVWATLGALLGALWGWIIPPHSSRKA